MSCIRHVYILNCHSRRHSRKGAGRRPRGQCSSIYLVIGPQPAHALTEREQLVEGLGVESHEAADSPKLGLLRRAPGGAGSCREADTVHLPYAHSNIVEHKFAP